MSSKSNRRQFLKKSAFAAAFPAIVPSSVFGKSAPSNKVNIGCIGVGGRGSGLLNNVLQYDQARVVAVSDCFESRRQKALNKIKDYYTKNKRPADVGAKAYADFRQLLDRDDIDGVTIATQDHWHVPISIYSVQAGKDVYVEKPLGVSLDYAFKLRKLVQDKGAVLQYGTQQRSSYYFRFACELARNGYIGVIKSIDAWCAGSRAPGHYAKVFEKFNPLTPPEDVPEGLFYDRWIGPAPMKPYTANRVTPWGTYHVYDYALGFIAGWGAHPLDIAQWGNDTDETAPVYYEGTGTIPQGGLFDTVAEWDVRCKYADGVKMHFMDTITAMPVVKKYHPGPGDHGTTFHGTEGWVSVRRGALHLSDEKLRRIKLKGSDVHLTESNNHMGNYIECIKSRKKPISPIESAFQSDLISHLSNAAIRFGRPVKWDAEKEQVVGDSELAGSLNRKLRAPWKV